jgi:hypothetical protein
MIRSRTGPIYLGSFESCPTIFHPYEGWFFGTATFGSNLMQPS